MGAWPELDTEINVNVDTSDLDQLIDLINSSDLSEVFAPATEIFTDLKKGIEDGSSKGAKELAERTKSLQELTIGLNGSIARGALLNSINVEETGDRSYLVGTSIEHFYPLTIEKGRGAVVPVTKKFLHYYTLSGVEIFSKYSSPTSPKPFVELAYQQVLGEAEDIIWRNIANVTDR
ncbi:hypothetical protein [Methanobrevibacter olleyae]|uniref:HK97 gp10 family phage protein n=1 Tax=Methanobrevibacter olleyae TaxID=294671 RepID=A0A126R1P7_METOL|nr:hypothetical protein [Methanobrevibacter olleyae]AMK16320.1 hypothetical protein YLM1_1765 [Methanobrevibacter olleyae]